MQCTGFDNAPGFARQFVTGLGFLLLLWMMTVFFGCAPEIEETDLLIPIKFSSVPEGLVITESPERSIEIHISGPSNFVRQTMGQDLSYLVDLYTDLAYDPAGIVNFIEPGTYTIPIIKERINVRKSLNITRFNPNYITVKLDRELVKELLIQVPYAGSPAAGYVALSAVSDPLTVLVRGPESSVAPLEKLQTKPVDLTGARETFKKKVPLDLDSSTMIQPSQNIMLVTVPIQEEISVKVFENLGVKTMNGINKAKVTPPEIALSVKGPSNLLKTAGIRDQFEVYIDLKDLGPGVYVRRAVIRLPLGLILTDARPEIFTVTIQ